MIGRVGHFEDSINGVYQRVKGEAKKEDVRFFYEKSDGVLLCYGNAAWQQDNAEKAPEKKTTKGWMIGWWQDLRAVDVPDGGETKRLFIAARCPMGEAGSQNFLWEVRDMEGDFQSDESTQLVLLPDKEKEAPSPGRVTLRLADEVGLHPDKASPSVGPSAAAPGFDPNSPLTASPFAGFHPMPSPLAHLGSPFLGMPGQMPPALFHSAETGKKGKKKKNKKGAAGGLRAEAPAFVPGAAMAGGPMLPPFPFMPFPPPPEFFARPPMPGAVSPLVAINAKYLTAAEEAEPVTAAPAAAPASQEQAAPPPPKAKTMTLPDGLTCTETKVDWSLSAVKAKLEACGKGEGVQSPEFSVTKGGVTGPPMQLTFYPNGHPMSPSGCVAVMLECSSGARMKFKVVAGSQRSGPKVLMGNRFHVDFAGSSVFRPAGSTEEEKDDAVAPPMNFDELACGLELLDWM